MKLFPINPKIGALGAATLMMVAAAGPIVAKRPVSQQTGKRATAPQAPRSIEMKQETPGPAFAQRWQSFSKRGAGESQLFTRFSAMTGAPRVVYGDLGEAPVAGKLGDRATLFLQANADAFGVDVTHLALARSVENGKANHYFYTQSHEGLPVFYGRVSVHIDETGHVRGLTNTYTPVMVRSVEPRLAPETAHDIAVGAVGVADGSAIITGDTPERTLGIWPTSDGGRLAYRVTVDSRDPVGYFEVFVDANTGAVLEEPHNLMFLVDGVGKVFTPNPVVTEANDLLRDNADNAVCATCPPEGSYKDVLLPNLIGSGQFVGTYAQIHPSHTTPANFPGNNFSSLRRNQNEFNQEQVYWALDKAATTFQSLGQTNVMNYSIRFYAHDSPSWGNQDQSSFSGDNSQGGGTGLLQFGTGGVDDAEDSEIVWHEYGHATLWNQVPGLNQNVIREGLGEGFGDYLAGTMSKRVPGDPSYYVTVGEWDAVSYNAGGTPHPNLRNLNTPTFWESRPTAVHSAGQVWSHPLFDYDNQVGPDVALRTVLESHFLYDLSPTQVEGANALLTADAMINQGATSGQIRNAFFERHTLPGTVVPVVQTIGVVPVGSSAFFLRNSATVGPADITVGYGGGAQTPIVGDWDGNGSDTLGRFDPSTNAFFLRNSNTPGPGEIVFTFGPAGANWTPIVGDWDNNGTETIGLYDPATGNFFLKNTNAPGPADLVYGFGGGAPTFLPVAGDWDGDGTDTVGLYNRADGAFFLKNAHGSGPADSAFQFGGGGALPVVGDWDANNTHTVGIYIASTGTFFLTNTNASGPASYAFAYGPAESTPLVGDWNGGMH